MIGSIVSTAMSGMRAAEARMQASAENIANLNSTVRTQQVGAMTREVYSPTRVQQTSMATGGVQVNRQQTAPTTQRSSDPEMSNTDLAGEVVEQQVATYGFKANLKVLEAADKMTQSLLDITV